MSADPNGARPVRRALAATALVITGCAGSATDAATPESPASTTAAPASPSTTTAPASTVPATTVPANTVLSTTAPPTSEQNPGVGTRALPAGSTVLRIEQEIDGQPVTRDVHIVAPSTLDPDRRYPVVFAFHGAGGNGREFSRSPAIVAAIDRGEFVGVFPDGHADNGGPGGFWNLGNEPTSADDVAFVDMIVAELRGFDGLDTDRMFSMGFSNGGGMSNLLGKTTDHFLAIAPMFSQQLVTLGALQPPRPLSVFQVTGVDDGLIPHRGGQSPVGEFMDAGDSALDWATRMNCDPAALVTDDRAWGEVSLNVESYGGCDGGVDVVVVAALDTEHGFRSREANHAAIDAMWEFFRSR